jgi:hypothetical protein
MMLEKECGIVKDAKFPTLWSPSIGSGPMMQLVTTIIEPNRPALYHYLQFSNRYRHKITGTCQSSPTPIYGGILADVSLLNIAKESN